MGGIKNISELISPEDISTLSRLLDEELYMILVPEPNIQMGCVNLQTIHFELAKSREWLTVFVETLESPQSNDYSKFHISIDKFPKGIYGTPVSIKSESRIVLNNASNCRKIDIYVSNETWRSETLKFDEIIVITLMSNQRLLLTGNLRPYYALSVLLLDEKIDAKISSSTLRLTLPFS